MGNNYENLINEWYGMLNCWSKDGLGKVVYLKDIEELKQKICKEKNSEDLDGK